MADKKHVVLYIDDDQDCLDAVRAIVEGGGYTMIEGHSAAEGLRLFEKEKPDFLLVDLMMEEIDAGTRFVREAKGMNPKIPVYVLSSVGKQLGSMIDTTDLGAKGVLQKPIQSDVLLSILKASIA